MKTGRCRGRDEKEVQWLKVGVTDGAMTSEQERVTEEVWISLDRIRDLMIGRGEFGTVQ